jgi:biotin carboxyl carrier protein
MHYEVSVGEKIYRVEMERTENPAGRENSGPVSWNIRLDGREISVNCLRIGDNSLSLIANGESFETRIDRSGEALTIFLEGKPYHCIVHDPRSLRSSKRTGTHEAGEQRITASMPGKVVRVLARAGEAIQAGQGILVIEAMKMQNEVRAPKAGTLKSIVAQQGANVNAGEVLATIE